MASNTGAFLGVFAVWLLVVDMPLRPIAAKYTQGLTHLAEFVAGYSFCPHQLPPFCLSAWRHGTVVRQGKGTDDEEQAEKIMASLALGELQGQIAEHERDMIESILIWQIAQWKK